MSASEQFQPLWTPWQSSLAWRFAQNDKRFFIIFSGRRSGKSHIIQDIMIEYCLNHKKSTVYYVAPTSDMAREIMFKPILNRIYEPDLIKKIKRPDLSNKIIRFKNGSELHMKSAEKQDRLRGARDLHLVVLDEFSQMKKEIWTSILRPSLTNTLGKAIFISTPEWAGDWTQDLFEEAQNDDEWFTRQTSTLEAGLVCKEEIEAARKTMTDKEWRREFLATFESLGNLAYYNFDPLVNVGDYKDNGSELFIGMDFNFDPMSAVVMQKAAKDIHVIDEFCLWDSNTTEMCKAIQRKYDARKINVCPDASGQYGTTAAGRNVTDHSVIDSFGWTIYTGRSNPGISDRVENTNRLLKDASGVSHMFIDRSCKTLIKCLQRLPREPGTTKPDKKLKIEHMPDANDYGAWQISPPQKRELKIDVRMYG